MPRERTWCLQQLWCGVIQLRADVKPNVLSQKKKKKKKKGQQNAKASLTDGNRLARCEWNVSHSLYSCQTARFLLMKWPAS